MFPRYPNAVASSVNKPVNTLPSLTLPVLSDIFFSYTTFPSSLKQSVALLLS